MDDGGGRTQDQLTCKTLPDCPLQSAAGTERLQVAAEFRNRPGPFFQYYLPIRWLYSVALTGDATDKILEQMESICLFKEFGQHRQGEWRRKNSGSAATAFFIMSGVGG